jgi:poly-gamma-glutamate system protein
MPTHTLNRLPSAFALSLALLLGAAGTGRSGAPAGDRAGTAAGPKIQAAGLMARSLDSIRRLRQVRHVPLDTAIDPNGTGIIGEEFTPLTTSLGEADAKRTTANPAFAAALVDYFRRAGLARGDVVAVGASGSFPALLLASLCAARVLELEPIVIYSVGSSMFGANLPGFTFVDMLAGLREDGVIPYRLAAVSPGGDGDGGGGALFDEAGSALLDEARRSGLPMVEGTSLAERIQDRLRIYDAARGGRPVRCFVNIGGASANFGDTPDSLKLKNGLLLRIPALPRAPTRGLLFEFAARGVPVVHLLYVRGLAGENHLPFDPVPFPPVGEGQVFR